MNGAAAVQPLAAAPQGDPNVIRAISTFLEMAKRGELVGVAIVGLMGNGSTAMSPVLPQNPAAMQIAVGALFGLMRQVDDNLIKMRTQQTASPIIPARAFG
jgi:hypothetical protein